MKDNISSIVEEVKEEPKKIKKNIFKITVNYYTDRDPIMKALYNKDRDIEFKIIDKWDFKVKTSLSRTELIVILIHSKEEGFTVRKAWIF